MAKIILDYATEAQFRAAWASAPTNLVERGDTLEFVQTKAEIFWGAPVNLTGIVAGPDNGILLSCALNASYVENPDIANLPFAYSATAGAAWRIHGENRPYLLNVDVPYLTIKGMQFMQAAGDTQKTMIVTANGSYLTVLHSIIESSGQLAYCYPLEINGTDNKVISSLITHRSSSEAAVYMNGSNALFENVSIVRTGDFTKGSSAFNLVRSGAKIQNCVATGFDALTNNASATGDNNACSGTISFGSNKIENVSAADIWINPINDFRTKSTSGVVDSGGPLSINNVRAPNGVRQQGTSVDRGAWEQPSILVAPTATVTNITVVGRKVTISGTTTGAPEAARSTATLTVDNVAYNSGVAPAAKNLTTGTNAFTVEFDTIKIGSYGVNLVAANSAYTVAGTNPVGSFQIEGPKALTVVQSIDGQRYRLSGTTSGNPVSGTLLLPANVANPDGATDRSMPLTITTGAFNLDEFITASGNYDAGILRFSTEAGITFPQPGTSPIYIMGMSGNPQIPDMEETTVPKVTAVDVTPATGTIEADGEIQLVASVVGDNYPAQAVTWTAAKGSVSTNGLFKGHSPSTDEVVIVTAKSIADSAYSDTASILVKAKAVVVPPLPIVTGVIVIPPAVITPGKPIQLGFIVNGTNSPAQSVKWTPTNLVDSTGLVTLPGPTSVEQTFVIRATSTEDPTKYIDCTIVIPAMVVTDPVPSNKATRASIKMVSPDGTVLANLTGLDCAFFDQIRVGTLLAPVAKTLVGFTDSNGFLSMNIIGTALEPGQSGRIVVAQDTKAFTGVVVVS